jgi:hypothetical protein
LKISLLLLSFVCTRHLPPNDAATIVKLRTTGRCSCSSLHNTSSFVCQKFVLLQPRALSEFSRFSLAACPLCTKLQGSVKYARSVEGNVYSIKPVCTGAGVRHSTAVIISIWYCQNVHHHHFANSEATPSDRFHSLTTANVSTRMWGIAR